MKYLKYTVLIITTLIWIVALSPELSAIVTPADSYRYGDLYRLSNLSAFKDPQQPCTEYKIPVHQKSGKKIHLYLIGDSFTEKQRIGKKDFIADFYTHVRWSDVLHVKPDTSEINILLLESVERHFREKFTTAPIRNLIPDSATYIPAATPKPFMTRIDQAFSADHTKERLDEILFQNDFVLGLKQLKADFNYHFFNRTNQEVTPVNGGKGLVYYMDTDTPEITSSFSKIRESEIDSIVDNLNKSKELAMQAGFDHVILSIIPNKVSVLMPTYGHYNNLISRIYSNPALDLPYIDVYQDFRKMGDEAYLKGDSHWTCRGQYLWLDKTNNLIQHLEGKPSL
jgi:hypothetical protein